MPKNLSIYSIKENNEQNKECFIYCINSEKTHSASRYYLIELTNEIKEEIKKDSENIDNIKLKRIVNSMYFIKQMNCQPQKVLIENQKQLYNLAQRLLEYSIWNIMNNKDKMNRKENILENELKRNTLGAINLQPKNQRSIYDYVVEIDENDCKFLKDNYNIESNLKKIK